MLRDRFASAARAVRGAPFRVPVEVTGQATGAARAGPHLHPPAFRAILVGEPMTDLFVVIATADRCELLRRTLDSLAECRLPAGFRGVVVIENGPPRGVEAVVREGRPELRARYVYREEGNKSAALNAALEELRGAWIVFADDDVRFDPGQLGVYADATAGAESGCFFGGPTSVDYEEPPPDWLRPYLPPSARGWQPSADDDPERLIFLGFNWAAHADELLAAGGFDPNRGPGARTRSVGQETDMQQRLLERGLHSRYLPDARVWHYVPRERCSKEWVLERARRQGIWSGLHAGFGRQLRGHWRYARAWAGLQATRLATDEARRFAREYRLAKAAGLLEGRRRRAGLDETTRPALADARS